MESSYKYQFSKLPRTINEAGQVSKHWGFDRDQTLTSALISQWNVLRSHTSISTLDLYIALWIYT